MGNGEFGLVLLFATVALLVIYWVPYYLIKKLENYKLLKNQPLKEKLIKYTPLAVSLFACILFLAKTISSETYIPYYQNLFYLISFVLVFVNISIVTFIKKNSHRFAFIALAYILMIGLQLLNLIP